MSAGPTHDDIETLVRGMVLPFYHVQRDTLLPLSNRRWENDAEHSWSVAFLACALAPQIDATLNVGLVAQFALAHDIIEIYADDTSPFDSHEKRSSKLARESAALDRLAVEYAHFPWIVETVKAYERKDTDEARFVGAIDKYITVLFDYIDEGRQLREYKLTHEAYAKSLETQRKKVHQHPGVAVYYEQIRALLADRPDFFHQ